MKDTVLLDNGKSRFLRSVSNFLSLYPTYESMVAALVAGTLPVDFAGVNSAGCAQIGTSLNKANLLSDATAQALGLSSQDPTINEALAALAEKQGAIIVSGLLKGDGSGSVSAAVAGTDYALPSAIPAAYTYIPQTDGVGSAGSSKAWARGDHRHPTDTSRQAKITETGLLKCNGFVVTAAEAGVDYQAPLTAGTDYATPASVPAASSAAPQMDGTAAAGSSSAFARADHVHPADTGRQAKITASGVLSGDGNGNITAKAVDTAPASGSSNLITSGAVYAAILGAIGGSY